MSEILPVKGDGLSTTRRGRQFCTVAHRIADAQPARLDRVVRLRGFRRNGRL
jgi:hypothetical protein